MQIPTSEQGQQIALLASRASCLSMGQSDRTRIFCAGVFEHHLSAPFEPPCTIKQLLVFNRHVQLVKYTQSNTTVNQRLYISVCFGGMVSNSRLCVAPCTATVLPTGVMQIHASHMHVHCQTECHVQTTSFSQDKNLAGFSTGKTGCNS